MLYKTHFSWNKSAYSIPEHTHAHREQCCFPEVEYLCSIPKHKIKNSEVITGPNTGNRIYIPRMNMSPSDSPWPFKLIRRQFPFIVSYAMTINKSQGQSLEHVGLYLPHRVFSHGQLYVALSRVKSKKRLHILIHDNQGIPKNLTTNVVYKEIFSNL